jgi:hypothetical protein
MGIEEKLRRYAEYSQKSGPLYTELQRLDALSADEADALAALVEAARKRRDARQERLRRDPNERGLSGQELDAEREEDAALDRLDALSGPGGEG